MDFSPFKQAAIAAAYESAKILRSRFGNISRIRTKAAMEIVTEADIESEQQIIATIHARFPDHAFLSEECGLKSGASEYKWIIDPLDGTVNFAHQIPIFCISIALTYREDTIVGVVLNPVDGELYTAICGQGAQLNGRRIQTSSVETVSQSLLVTGFPYDVNEVFEPIIERYASCLKASQAIRRLGSAALDICYVACGRFEGFWEQNLKAWDTAAGALIASEAGATVTTFSNQPYLPGDKEILATNGRIHAEMLALLEISDQQQSREYEEGPSKGPGPRSGAGR